MEIILLIIDYFLSYLNYVAQRRNIYEQLKKVNI